MKRLLTVILGATVIASGATVATAAKPKVDIPYWVVRPCASAHDVNCRDESGHVNIRRQIPNGNHTVCVFFADRAYARTHDYCS